MGRVGRTYPREGGYTYENRDSAAAYQRFHESAFRASHEVIATATRHKVAGSILALLFALGFTGWLFTL
jgi:hypothetical protein